MFVHSLVYWFFNGCFYFAGWAARCPMPFASWLSVQLAGLCVAAIGLNCLRAFQSGCVDIVAGWLPGRVSLTDRLAVLLASWLAFVLRLLLCLFVGLFVCLLKGSSLIYSEACLFV